MEELKVGLVGCGHISQAHLRAFQKTKHCKVHGVFDLNEDLAAQRARTFGIDKVYDDLDVLIEECDVVDVCTPPQTHADIALKVIEAGKHLLIEKPLVVDVADWDRLAAALEMSRSEIAVVHNLKFTNAIQQAKRWLEAGRIGTLIRIERFFLTSPKDDRMLGRPHWSHALPGGRWFETLPHELYITHYFAGPSEVTHVSALHTSHAPEGAPADEVTITLQNEHCLTHIHYSGNCHLNKRQVTFIGTEGIIHVDILSDALWLSKLEDKVWKRPLGLTFLEASGRLVRAVPDRLGYLRDRMRKETPHARLIKAFDAYLAGAGPSPTPVEEIDFVVRNAERIGRAIDEQAERMVAS